MAFKKGDILTLVSEPWHLSYADGAGRPLTGSNYIVVGVDAEYRSRSLTWELVLKALDDKGEMVKRGIYYTDFPRIFRISSLDQAIKVVRPPKWKKIAKQYLGIGY